MDLLEGFLENWNRKFALPGTPLLLAVSGGRDSMVLAHLLLQSKIPFAMAHCNFMLRAEEADEDEALVENWAKNHAISFFKTRFNTADSAASLKMGIQEAARKLRYDWLETTRKENHFSFIATAHHAGDNAETMLINLFKGTGIAGLHGIREKNKNIIRPLLFASREMINSYAEANAIAYRDDSSNASDKYLRNAVRLKIIPTIQQYFPAVIDRLNESIHRMAQVEIIYQKEIDRQIKRLTELRGKDVYVPVAKLLKTDAVETICYELFRPYGFSAAQVPQLLQLAGAMSGKFIESEKFRVIRDRNFLIITAREQDKTDFILIEKIPAKLKTGGFQCTCAFATKDASLLTDPSVAIIDADVLEFPLVLRKWRMGDYFYPLGMGMKKKKLSRFFIDQKIPLHQKENILVLESKKRIVWVAGLRIDERFKVKPETQNRVRIEIKPL